MKNLVCASILLGLATSASAVNINADGSGQVLIYPAYTTDGDFDTLVSLTNDTSDVKAVKVKMLERALGTEVLVFNVYLKPFDTWVAAGTGSSNFEPARIVVPESESTCTVPAIPAEGQPFSDILFENDELLNDPQRTRIGYIEAFEMGVVSGDSADAIINEDCATLVGAFSDGGYWDVDSTVDLAPPTGGLAGSGWLISVAAGEGYSYDATAIAGFSSEIMHQEPGELTPDLTMGSADGNGQYVAQINTDDGVTNVAFDNGLDSISALLMSTGISADFVLQNELEAESVIYLTAPTLKYHTSALFAPGGSPSIAPFSNAAGPAGASNPVTLDLVNREGVAVADCDTVNTQIPPTGGNGVPDFLSAVNPVVITNEILFTNPSISNNIRPNINAGRIAFHLGNGLDNFAVCDAADFDGRVLSGGTVVGGANDGQSVSLNGLPMIGIMFNNVRNNTLQDDFGVSVVSNFGVDFKVRSRLAFDSD